MMVMHPTRLTRSRVIIFGFMVDFLLQIHHGNLWLIARVGFITTIQIHCLIGSHSQAADLFAAEVVAAFLSLILAFNLAH